MTTEAGSSRQEKENRNPDHEDGLQNSEKRQSCNVLYVKQKKWIGKERSDKGKEHSEQGNRDSHAGKRESRPRAALCKTYENHRYNAHQHGHGRGGTPRRRAVLSSTASIRGSVLLDDFVAAKLPIQVGHNGLRIANLDADLAVAIQCLYV